MIYRAKEVHLRPGETIETKDTDIVVGWSIAPDGPPNKFHICVHMLERIDTAMPQVEPKELTQ